MDTAQLRKTAKELTHFQLDLVKRVHALSYILCHPPNLPHILSSIVGYQCTLKLANIHWYHRVKLLEDNTSIFLIFRHKNVSTQTAILSLPRSVAFWIIERCLGNDIGEPPPVVGEELSQTETGILTFVTTKVLEQGDFHDWHWHCTIVEAQALHALDENHEGWVSCAFELKTGSKKNICTFFLSQEAAAAIPAHSRVAYQACCPQLDLPLTCDVHLPPFTLLSADLPQMEKGDAILCGQTWDRLGPVSFDIEILCSAIPSMHWEATLDPRDGKIKLAHQGKGATVGTSKPRSDDDGEKMLSLKDAPVQVRCELGRFELSLHDLQRLSEQQIIETGLVLSDRVTLFVAEQKFATGDLIHVEGQLAIRITELESTKPKGHS